MTNDVLSLTRNTALAAPLNESEANTLAAQIGAANGLHIYPHSLTSGHHALFFLCRKDTTKLLGVISANAETLARFHGIATKQDELTELICECTPANAAAMRALFDFLVPKTLGLKKSAGCGDRLGLATPGHVQAIRKSSMAPIFSQQSIRENTRTGRNPQIVQDDALWGVLQEGWRDGFGADADHLKTTEDIDVCAAAGYTFYTIDPSAHVDNAANTAPLPELRDKCAALPWAELATTWDDTQARLQKTFDLSTFKFTLDEESLLRAAAKYGRVIAHTVKMYRYLESAMSARDFELEMSVDESDTVTTVAEHIYIANELKRLGVKWVSLAPRYVGDFEKGVDYIGDLGEFERSFAQHFAVSQTYGPYKLSLQSGSDKFSVYPIAARVAGEFVHLKTAGTSYLEALRAIGKHNAPLFRAITQFAIERYPTDRATYHVSAQVEKMPRLEALADDQLMTLLDDFHAREILHVTFGSVLHHADFREPFFATLRENEGTYAELLEIHFGKHFAPFDAAAKAAGD